MSAKERCAYLTDEEFREKYTPFLDHFEDWRARLNHIYGLHPNGSMETVVRLIEADKGANVVPLRPAS